MLSVFKLALAALLLLGPSAILAVDRDGRYQRDRGSYDRWPERSHSEKEWRKERKDWEKDRRKAWKQEEKDRRAAAREWEKDRREAAREARKNHRNW